MSEGGNQRHAVHVERQRLKFAAAHMATFAGDLEPLHGHNYAAILEVEGNLTSVGWLVDFSTLKRIGREICDRLDHHFLLQARSPHLQVTQDHDTWAIVYRDRAYRLPACDVLALPIANSTAELIAAWFWEEAAAALRLAGVRSIRRLDVGIEEAPGQSGWFGADLDF